jgi:hypothetical protein
MAKPIRIDLDQTPPEGQDAVVELLAAIALAEVHRTTRPDQADGTDPAA